MNQELINQYKKALKSHNDKIEIRIIHHNQDLCFTIYQREYMNAIRKCFNRSKEEHYAYYNETILGMYVCIPINKLPSIPPFHDFDFYYKKEYFKRLNLLEEYFNNNNIDYENLKKERKQLDLNCNVVSYLPFPNEILNIIGSFVKIDIQKYYNLREKYQKIRKDL